jgi:L-carnitine CoA-transferase
MRKNVITYGGVTLMARKSDIPEFGCLSGLKVVNTSQSIAGPFIATVMAEQGADVIWVEWNRDGVRNAGPTMIEQNRKNQRNIALNYFAPEAREVFFTLLKDADILIESNRGGTFAKKGLTDEVLWEANPKLVIVHVSGFGQWGDPGWVSRPSWDAVGQAASGYQNFNGFPDRDPIPGNPYPCDYFSAMFGVYGALAGYIKAQKTGKGESIDVAQYEVLMRVDSAYWSMHMTDGFPLPRTGSGNPSAEAMDNYKCKDGNLITILAVGFVSLKGAMQVLGLDYGSEEWPAPPNNTFYEAGSEVGKKLDQKIREYCAAHTVEEVDEAFSKAGCPCSPIMNYELMQRNPHFKARGVLSEWKSVKGRTIKGIDMFPKFKNNPSKMWCPAPLQGQDTEDILLDHGYTAEQISEMYEKNIIKKVKK